MRVKCCLRIPSLVALGLALGARQLTRLVQRQVVLEGRLRVAHHLTARVASENENLRFRLEEEISFRQNSGRGGGGRGGL
jgi:hypothetical protein